MSAELEWTHDFTKGDHTPCRVYSADLNLIHPVARCNVNTGVVEVYKFDGNRFVIDKITRRVERAIMSCSFPLIIQELEFDASGINVSPLLCKAG